MDNTCGNFSGISNQYFLYYRYSTKHKWEWSGIMNSNKEIVESYKNMDLACHLIKHPETEMCIEFFSNPNLAPYKWRGECSLQKFGLALSPSHLGVSLQYVQGRNMQMNQLSTGVTIIPNKQ